MQSIHSSDVIVNKDPALETSFILEIPGLPHLNYHVQKAPLPGINVPGVPAPYRNHQGVVPGNRINYSAFNVQFLVDEDFENYFGIVDWMKDATNGELPLMGHAAGAVRDIRLHLLNSNKHNIAGVDYVMAFPTDLSELDFGSDVTDGMPLVANVTFEYQRYDLHRHPKPN